MLAHPRRSLPISQLPRYDLPQYIPTLSELYRTCGTEFFLSLDMMDPRSFDSVIEVAQEYGALERLWLTYWRLPVLADWRARQPGLHLVYATLPVRRGGITGVLDALAVRKIDGINIHHLACTRFTVAAARALGVRVFAWGLRRERWLRRAVERDVDGVFCDDVEAMVRVLEGASRRDPYSS